MSSSLKYLSNSGHIKSQLPTHLVLIRPKKSACYTAPILMSYPVCHFYEIRRFFIVKFKFGLNSIAKEQIYVKIVAISNSSPQYSSKVHHNFVKCNKIKLF